MTKTVSIGICAYNEANRIPSLLDSLVAQRLPRDFALEEILVVASGCTDGTDRIVEERGKREPKLILIREPERRGKSSALNIILSRYRGDILVLVNADARLLPDALFELLIAFAERDDVELACGSPIPDSSRNSLLAMVEGIWWRIHNQTLLALATVGEGNHCCDELMAMKRGFANSIPAQVICDGSYFGTLAAIRGITVQFCPNSKVAVEIPSSLYGLLRQRWRNVRGHRQVARLLGEAPHTLEDLVKRRPALAAKILGSELAGRPIDAAVLLLVVLPLECVAQVRASLETASHRGYQPLWPMVE